MSFRRLTESYGTISLVSIGAGHESLSIDDIIDLSLMDMWSNMLDFQTAGPPSYFIFRVNVGY